MRVSVANFLATRVESFKLEFRIAMSKPPSTMSRIESLRRRSRVRFGCFSKKSSSAGIRCIRPKDAGAVTRNVPCGEILPEPTEA